MQPTATRNAAEFSFPFATGIMGERDNGKSPEFGTFGGQANAKISCVMAFPGDLLRFTTCDNYADSPYYNNQNVGKCRGACKLTLATGTTAYPTRYSNGANDPNRYSVDLQRNYGRDYTFSLDPDREQGRSFVCCDSVEFTYPMATTFEKVFDIPIPESEQATLGPDGKRVVYQLSVELWNINFAGATEVAYIYVGGEYLGTCDPGCLNCGSYFHCGNFFISPSQMTNNGLFNGARVQITKSPFELGGNPGPYARPIYVVSSPGDGSVFNARATMTRFLDEGHESYGFPRLPNFNFQEVSPNSVEFKYTILGSERRIWHHRW